MKNKKLECLFSAVIALILSSLIVYLILGAILEGEKTTYYNDVLVVGELK